MRLEVIEDGIARDHRDGMRLIRETVLEGAGAAFEYGSHARRNEDSAEWRVAAGDSLPDQNDVGLNVPVLHGEWLSGAAHATHDFIGDQKDSPIAADFRDALRITIRRHRSSERRADDRFEDEGGDG